jgi:hypothetical protein
MGGNVMKGTDATTRSERPTPESGRQPRAPYEPPELTEYGSVEKLTQGTLSHASDGPFGGFRKVKL